MLEKKDYLCPIKIKDMLFEILVRNGRVDSWLSSGLENRRPFTRVAGSNPVSSATLPLRITVSTYGFGPYGGSSILSGVTKGLVEPQE